MTDDRRRWFRAVVAAATSEQAPEWYADAILAAIEADVHSIVPTVQDENAAALERLRPGLYVGPGSVPPLPNWVVRGAGVGYAVMARRPTLAAAVEDALGDAAKPRVERRREAMAVDRRFGPASCDER